MFNEISLYYLSFACTIHICLEQNNAFNFATKCSSKLHSVLSLLNNFSCHNSEHFSVKLLPYTNRNFTIADWLAAYILKQMEISHKTTDVLLFVLQILLSTTYWISVLSYILQIRVCVNLIFSNFQNEVFYLVF